MSLGGVQRSTQCTHMQVDETIKPIIMQLCICKPILPIQQTNDLLDNIMIKLHANPYE